MKYLLGILLATLSLNTTAVSDKSLRKFQDVKCVAEVIYRESRGEPYRGKLAVGQVVLNRIKHDEYPRTPCGIIFQKNQFSWSKGFKGFVAPNEFISIAETVLSGTHEMQYLEATHFHAKYVHPRWKNLKKVAIIGNHIFYKI